MRDEVVDFVNRWSQRMELAASRLLRWLGLGSSKFFDWRRRYGQVNEHNAWIPRDHWLEDWEKQAILEFEGLYPLEGYRRLAFMMLDRDVVAVSPSSVYRVLKAAGRLGRWNRKPSRKGCGFEQPLAPHQHWHVDVSYINIGGTFYYLCSVLDGYSRTTPSAFTVPSDTSRRRTSWKDANRSSSPSAIASWKWRGSDARRLVPSTTRRPPRPEVDTTV